jgi:Transposase IS116/IS110/IS902 family
VGTLGTLIAPTSGSATVAGFPLTPSNGVEIRRRISIMPESPGLYLRLSVAENLGCFADLYEVADPSQRIDRVLRAVKLADRAGDACRSRRWSRPAMKCCDQPDAGWPATGSGIPPRARNPMPRMGTCWPRSSDSIVSINRPIAGDTPLAEAVKLMARAHQTMIWDRSRAVLRLRAAVRGFLPSSVGSLRRPRRAGSSRAARARAPDPDRAARLSKAKITAAFTRARRKDVEARALHAQQIFRAPQLRQPPAVQTAYAVIVANTVRLIGEFNRQISELGEVVAEHFGRHRDAELYLSQPGLGSILAARVLAEFGDDLQRFTDAKARKNYAGTSPITRASGIRRIVLARYARNRRLGDAVHQSAFCAIRGSPGAKAYYKTMRGPGIGHQAALRQLSNRLVGILHGCLKTGTLYDETPPGHICRVLRL